MLHNARRTFGAQNSLVYGVVTISFDIADFIVSDVYIDPTPASTHVASGLLDFITNFGAVFYLRLRRHFTYLFKVDARKICPGGQCASDKTISQTVKFDIFVRIC